MADGWFIFLLLAGFLTFGGTLVIFWLKSSATVRKEEQALTASDLQLMEDTVQALIDRLTAASDEAVAAIEVRQATLHALLDRVDERVPRFDDAEAITRLAGDGVGDAEIAQLSGITRGEVELLLELQAARVDR